MLRGQARIVNWPCVLATADDGRPGQAPDDTCQGPKQREAASDSKTGATRWCPRSIAKLVYNSNNYGLWHL